MAGAAPIIHHKTTEFRQLFAATLLQLKNVLLSDGEVALLSASASGGLEALIANLTAAGDTVIVVAGGVFGERWALIAEALGRAVIRVEVEWGQAVDPELVERALAQHPQTAMVCVTFCETSTAVMHPVEELSAVVHKSEALLAVDAVSGLASAPYFMDGWRVDATVSGAQKGLMCPPGLALIALGERAVAALERGAAGQFYWSLAKYLDAYHSDALPAFPWTPSVTLIRQLHQALRLILDEGLEAVWQRHRLMGLATRAAVTALGLQLLAPQSACPAVTAVVCPEGLAAGQITKRMLQQWGINIAGGQGKLKNKIFRIGHLGYCDLSDVLMTVAALEYVLCELGQPVVPGSGVAAAQHALFSASQGREACLGTVSSSPRSLAKKDSAC